MAPIAPATGTNKANTPKSTRPLAKHTIASPTTSDTVSAVPVIEPGSSSPNGLVPSTTRAAKAVATTTASNDERPSSVQYTSSSRTQRANSSIVKPAPTPKVTATMCHHGASSGAANARKPENIIRQMPQTR